jgi:hypothetical protein
MKITKKQLKKLIKEELNELTGEEVAGIPRPTGRTSFYADRIPEALSRHNVQLSDIVLGLGELAPHEGPSAHSPSHFERAQADIQVEDVIGALANLLVEKYGESGPSKK